jgi:coenzyme PQQ precursor peptide PqqA
LDKRAADARLSGIVLQEHPMAWSKPRVVEIRLDMEINCYATAELSA